MSPNTQIIAPTANVSPPFTKLSLNLSSSVILKRRLAQLDSLQSQLISIILKYYGISMEIHQETYVPSPEEEGKVSIDNEGDYISERHSQMELSDEGMKEMDNSDADSQNHFQELVKYKDTVKSEIEEDSDSSDSDTSDQFPRLMCGDDDSDSNSSVEYRVNSNFIDGMEDLEQEKYWEEGGYWEEEVLDPQALPEYGDVSPLHLNTNSSSSLQSEDSLSPVGGWGQTSNISPIRGWREESIGTDLDIKTERPSLDSNAVKSKIPNGDSFFHCLYHKDPMSTEERMRKQLDYSYKEAFRRVVNQNAARRQALRDQDDLVLRDGRIYKRRCETNEALKKEYEEWVQIQESLREAGD